MYADTLLAAERQHLLGIATWGGACFLVGAVLLLLLRWRRKHSALLMHFGLQTSLWGAVLAATSALRLPALALRDASGATRLNQMVWFSSGLEIGIAAMGLGIAATSWLAARRLGGVGAGLAIAAQGMALMVLDFQFLIQIAR